MYDESTAARLISEKIQAIYELISQIENVAEDAGLALWSDFDIHVGRNRNTFDSTAAE